jgi:hypothetical protein
VPGGRPGIEEEVYVDHSPAINPLPFDPLGFTMVNADLDDIHRTDLNSEDILGEESESSEGRSNDSSDEEDNRDDDGSDEVPVPNPTVGRAASHQVCRIHKPVSLTLTKCSSPYGQMVVTSNVDYHCNFMPDLNGLQASFTFTWTPNQGMGMVQMVVAGPPCHFMQLILSRVRQHMPKNL